MDRHQAIRNTHSTVVTINGNTDATNANGNSVTLDESLITEEVTRLQEDYDSKQYQRDRQYPSLAEQADMQYWDSVNGTTVWVDTIAAVKAAYPKD